MTKRKHPSADRDHHGGEGHQQNGNRSHEHSDAGRQGPDQPIATGAERCPMRRHARYCGSRIHNALLNAGARGCRLGEGAYSAAPAMKAAMSIVKPRASHSSSVGTIEITMSRTRHFTNASAN